MSPDDGDATVYPFAPSPPLAQPSPPPPGGSPGRRRSRRARLGKTAAGLAVVLGAGAGAATVALSGSASGGANLASSDSTASSPTTSTSTPGPTTSPSLPYRGKHSRFGYGPGLGPFGLAPGLFGVVHGTFTVRTADGKFETIDTQTGTVEAVASSSITVKSADGFSQTYQVTSSTKVGAEASGILSVKDGDQVSVEGLVSGGTVTAQRVLDITQLRQAHPGWADGGPPSGDDSPPGPPDAA